VFGALAGAVLVFAGLAGLGVLDLGAPWPGVAWGVGGALGVAAVAIAVGSIAARARLARSRAAGVSGAGRAALEAVLVEGLGDPTRDLIAAHKRVRELASMARDLPVPVSPAAA
jgi:hypothetical protein